VAWFNKDKSLQPTAGERHFQMPGDLWVKCKGCSEIIYRKEVLRNLSVCPKCNYHFNIPAPERMKSLFDDGNYAEIHSGITSADPLGFKDTKRYADRLVEYRKRSGAEEAVLVGRGKLGGIEIVLAVMEYNFMGGSMGSVVGEKVTRAIETSTSLKVPLIIVSATGGARMQEGALSLMQMAKISAALARHSVLAIPYISVLTDPTTGGVTASFAMLGDINLAEPRALIGFAGPRVIEQTTRKKLPDGFQRSEFLMEHGMLDLIVPRSEMKETLVRLLKHMGTTRP
jgi:acetyl-CoA carboxylase carboxyl transferase subunit beta